MPVSRSLLVFRAAVARWPSPPPSRRTRPFRARCPRGTRRSLSAARMRKPSAHAHAEEGRRGRAPATAPPGRGGRSRAGTAVAVVIERARRCERPRRLQLPTDGLPFLALVL